jgi:ubiquinone/menaquinone biosynthesis C-methylase UbiE
MANNKKFELFEKKIIKRFNDKIKNYPFLDPKVVGWDTKKNQYFRFSKALKNLNFKNKKVLDVGCGVGDFLNFCKTKKIIFDYTGLDINKNFIFFLKKKFKKYNFLNKSFLKFSTKKKYDHILFFGIFNLKMEEKKNYQYLFKHIEKAVKMSKNSVYFDFIVSPGNYKFKSKEIFYYNKKILLKFLTEKKYDFIYYADNKPIPQIENSIIILR